MALEKKMTTVQPITCLIEKCLRGTVPGVASKEAAMQLVATPDFAACRETFLGKTRAN
jgi:hypothetical protein